jgi:hypothetical protein
VANYTGPLPETYASTYESTDNDDIYNEEDVESEESNGDESLVTAIREAANRLLNAVAGRN